MYTYIYIRTHIYGYTRLYPYMFSMYDIDTWMHVYIYAPIYIYMYSHTSKGTMASYKMKITKVSYLAEYAAYL